MGLMQNQDPRAIRAREEHAQKMFDNSVSRNTRINYKCDLDKYLGMGFNLPAHPEEIVKYLNALAPTYNPVTLSHHIRAIRFWHRINDFIDPTDNEKVKRTFKGITNTYGVPSKKAKPFTLEDIIFLDGMLRKDGGLNDLRNNTLLQIGFFGAFRRSELTGMRLEHLSFTKLGVEILLPRSKADQAGKGKVVVIPYMQNQLCAVKTLQEWLALSCIRDGFVFPPTTLTLPLRVKQGRLSEMTVHQIIKSVAIRANFVDPNLYSCHSLRRGFATEAAKRGATVQDLMKHGRWKDAKVAIAYIDEGDKYNNATSLFDK